MKPVKVQKPHEHRAVDRGALYEYCKCGAVRKIDQPGKKSEGWHVCNLCRIR